MSTSLSTVRRRLSRGIIQVRYQRMGTHGKSLNGKAPRVAQEAKSGGSALLFVPQGFYPYRALAVIVNLTLFPLLSHVGFDAAHEPVHVAMEVGVGANGNSVAVRQGLERGRERFLLRRR